MTQVSEHHDTTTFTFDPFSRHRFYTEVNRALVERTLDVLEATHPPGEVLCLVELAFLEEVPVRFPLRAIQDIGRYALFIEGALAGVALPIGAEALSAAAALAFADLHLEFVPRNWLQLIARRTA